MSITENMPQGKKNKLPLICFVFILLLLLTPIAPAHAARYFLDSPESTYQVGDTIPVSVYVDSDGAKVNGFSGSVLHTGVPVSAHGALKENSIVSIWVEEPGFSRDADRGSFEGVSFGEGYEGPRGKIVTFIYQAESAGLANFRLDSNSILSGDGQGTNVYEGAVPLTVNIREGARQVQQESAISDDERPEFLSIKEIYRENNTKPVVEFIFESFDAASGISHYMVSLDNSEFERWEQEESVYETPVMENGNHTLVVRAFDEAGNYREEAHQFIVRGLEAPTISEYPRTIKQGDSLLIEGQAQPGADVAIRLENESGDVVRTMVRADEDGNFSTEITDTPPGIYSGYSIAYGEDGEVSQKSNAVALVINTAEQGEILGIPSSQWLIAFIIAAFVLLLWFVVPFKREEKTAWQENVSRRR